MISIACTAAQASCDAKPRSVSNSTLSFIIHSGNCLTPRNKKTANQFKIRTMFLSRQSPLIALNSTCEDFLYIINNVRI